MSLKAKLEAVIYAAEEPVTLAQLAALFASDALEWKAEQEAASAEAAAEALEAAEPAPLLAEGLEYLELKTEDGAPVEQPAAAVEPAAESPQESIAEPDGEPAPAMVHEPPPAPAEGEPAGLAEGDTEEPVPGGNAPVDAEAEAKRLARQRDREVKAILWQLLDELIASYVSDGRGVEIREIAGGYRMATKPECHDAVRQFVKSIKPPLKLSLPALETLAVIAYKQPVTAPEVNEIRGVDSSAVFGSLLSRKLITTAGRKPVIGRPILYKTTREFLLRFGLKDMSELPSMEEFEKMAAIELDDAAAETELYTDTSYEPGPDAGPELDEYASEEPEDAAAGSTAPAAVTPQNADPAPAASSLEEEPAAEEAAPAEPPHAEQAEIEIAPHD